MTAEKESEKLSLRNRLLEEAHSNDQSEIDRLQKLIEVFAIDNTFFSRLEISDRDFFSAGAQGPSN